MKMTTGKWLGATLLAGALGVAIPAAYSHDDGDGQGKEHCRRGEHGDRAERFDRRQRELHERLGLTAAQESAWTTFSNRVTPPTPPDREAIARDMSLPAPARMEAMIARMEERQKQMAANLSAVREFYAVLTPEQQKVFDGEFGPHGRHPSREKP